LEAEGSAVAGVLGVGRALWGWPRVRQGDWRLHCARCICALCWSGRDVGDGPTVVGALVLAEALWFRSRSRQGDWRLHCARWLFALCLFLRGMWVMVLPSWALWFWQGRSGSDRARVRGT